MTAVRHLVAVDESRFIGAAANLVVNTANEAVKARGRFMIALSGGTTPRRLFEHLALERAADIDWARWHVFWVDERCVPPSHADSNYRMTMEALLARVPVPGPQVRRMRGEDDPAAAAVEYEGRLVEAFGPGPDAPRFDLVLLGMGDDGHTASLFPGTAALDEAKRWVVANHVPRLGSWRLTLTYPILNAARRAVVFCGGAAKAAVLGDVFSGVSRDMPYPIERIALVDGELVWLVDEPALARVGRPARNRFIPA